MIAGMRYGNLIGEDDQLSNTVRAERSLRQQAELKRPSTPAMRAYAQGERGRVS